MEEFATVVLSQQNKTVEWNERVEDEEDDEEQDEAEDDYEDPDIELSPPSKPTPIAREDDAERRAWEREEEEEEASCTVPVIASRDAIITSPTDDFPTISSSPPPPSASHAPVDKSNRYKVQEMGGTKREQWYMDAVTDIFSSLSTHTAPIPHPNPPLSDPPSSLSPPSLAGPLAFLHFSPAQRAALHAKFMEEQAALAARYDPCAALDEAHPLPSVGSDIFEPPTIESEAEDIRQDMKQTRTE